ncbi:hypothetical protein [Collimonas humicola]|uniref:hypothetical protein n=1 Tax=Collimonas humicola TaxID=2825886 RepID=UPI001B8CAD76|nr:hypothetical protein [Collimonas humicola]
MAFFTTNNGEKLFDIYYTLGNKGTITGKFHSLTKEQFSRFAKLYFLFAILSVFLVVIETLLFLAFLLEPHADYADSWKFFLLAAPLLPVPLAIYLAPKRKVVIDDVGVRADIKASISAYTMLIGAFFSMAESTVWAAIRGQGMPGYGIWAAVFIALAAASIYRISTLVSKKNAGPAIGH